MLLTHLLMINFGQTWRELRHLWSFPLARLRHHRFSCLAVANRFHILFVAVDNQIGALRIGLKPHGVLNFDRNILLFAETLNYSYGRDRPTLAAVNVLGGVKRPGQKLSLFTLQVRILQGVYDEQL